MRSTSGLGLAAAWLFLGGLVGIAAFTWKRLPHISYGILFFLVASFPAGNFLPTFNGPINDAYVTIPSIGLAIAVAALCELLIRQAAERRVQCRAGAPVFLLILCALLVYRLPLAAAYYRYWAGVWANPAQLVLLISGSRPMQFQSKSFAALVLQRMGLQDHAESIARETLAESPWSSVAMLALGGVMKDRGEYPEAEQWFRKTIEAPDITRTVKDSALLEIADTIARTPSRRDEAADICRQLLQKDAEGQPPATIILLARIYQKQGDLPKARRTVERGLTIHPHDEGLQALALSLDSTPPSHP